MKVFEFTEDELAGLEEKKVRGAKNNTNFSVGVNEKGNFLTATSNTVSYTHLRAHETGRNLVCRLLLEKKI